MKNQYSGDVNDYRKYGILRQLAGPRGVHVVWMLTPDDERSDGRFTRYLSSPERWRDFDPELFDFLKAELVHHERRSVSEMEGWKGLPGRFFSAEVPDSREGRSQWQSELRSEIQDAEFVFFDPDNGIEVSSCPKGRKGSSKYVFWDELVEAWEGGASLLIYQHFTRENRDGFLARLAREIQGRLGALRVLVLRTAHVAFFVVPQDDWIDKAVERAEKLVGNWEGQVSLVEPLAAASGQRQASA